MFNSFRQQQFVSVRDNIKDMMQQLEMAARSSFEVEMFVSDPDTVCLSSANMLKVKDCQEDYRGRLDHTIKRANTLRCKIGTLWERLDVDQHTREMFSMENRGFAPSTIAVVSEYFPDILIK